jgi:toxin ParE1/3/4
MKPVRQEHAATLEMEAAGRWYEEHAAGLGERFYEAFLSARQFVQANPELGMPEQHGTRKWNLAIFPYKIVYYEQPEAVVIVAVAHHSRRPGYWLWRLDQ